MLNISNFMIREIKEFLIKFPLEDSCTKSMFPEMVLKFTMREISMYRVNIKCLPCLSSDIWEKKEMQCESSFGEDTGDPGCRNCWHLAEGTTPHGRLSQVPETCPPLTTVNAPGRLWANEQEKIWWISK